MEDKQLHEFQEFVKQTLVENGHQKEKLEKVPWFIRPSYKLLITEVAGFPAYYWIANVAVIVGALAFAHYIFSA